jgi:hypothetical protein
LSLEVLTVPRASRRSRLVLVISFALALVAANAPATFALEARFPDAERYNLELINCTRTGGWVQTDGTCADYGTGRHSRYRKPLRFHERLSADVARPQARRIARAGYLDHNLGGSIRTRFTRAGFGGTIGESLGWSTGSARDAVLRTHLINQAEKSYNGWHWRNIKNPDFRYVGLAVWRNAEGKFFMAQEFWGG